MELHWLSIVLVIANNCWHMQLTSYCQRLSPFARPPSPPLCQLLQHLFDRLHPFVSDCQHFPNPFPFPSLKYFVNGPFDLNTCFSDPLSEMGTRNKHFSSSFLLLINPLSCPRNSAISEIKSPESSKTFK